MPEILKLPQLPHRDRMAQMQVGGARVITAVYAQRPPFPLTLLQARAQVFGHVASRVGIAIGRA